MVINRTWNERNDYKEHIEIVRQCLCLIYPHYWLYLIDEFSFNDL
jgi:hypothetical protein